MTELTPEQTRFLAAFADNASSGRRMACYLAHISVAVGMLAGWAAGIIAAVVAVFTWYGHR